MHKPEMRAGVRIDAVPGAIDPVAFAELILDHKIVPHRLELAWSPPPLSKNPFRAVGAHDLPSLAPPGEDGRRLVRQQRDDVDALGIGQEPRRPRPFHRPCLTDVRRGRGNPPDRALRHIGGNGRDAKEPVAAIAENVDERRDVGDLLFDQRGSNLTFLQRLGEDGDQHQLLDAEAGIDSLDAVAEKLRQPSRISNRLGKTGAQMLPCIVDAIDEEVAAPCTKTIFRKAC